MYRIVDEFRLKLDGEAIICQASIYRNESPQQTKFCSKKQVTAADIPKGHCIQTQAVIILNLRIVLNNSSLRKMFSSKLDQSSQQQGDLLIQLLAYSVVGVTYHL